MWQFLYIVIEVQNLYLMGEIQNAHIVACFFFHQFFHFSGKGTGIADGISL